MLSFICFIQLVGAQKYPLHVNYNANNTLYFDKSYRTMRIIVFGVYIYLP